MTERSRSAWLTDAVRAVEAEGAGREETPLLRIPLPRFGEIGFFIKDEAAHPTGSLKHRLARSLLLHSLCSGWVSPDTPLIEASSGSTAVSTAYFAGLIGINFTAVVPATTAVAKVAAIKEFGGIVHFVDHQADVSSVAQALAAECGGRFLDQFTYAERATDWRRDNIAESIVSQLALTRQAPPSWIVCGAGTGGTSATIGRYTRFKRLATRLCVADPAASVFHRHFLDQSIITLKNGQPSLIEGIGRMHAEASFIPQVVDRVIAVEDARSIGAMRALSQVLGRSVGGSTGTNMAACADLIVEMAARRQSGSVATILCDDGSRYADTYYNDKWLSERNVDWQPHAEEFLELLT